MPVSGSRTITIPAVTKRPASAAVWWSAGSRRKRSMSRVWTCSCAGAFSTTTGGKGWPSARPMNWRMPWKSMPKAASQFPWQDSRFPITGMLWPSTAVNKSAGPPSSFFMMAAISRCGSTGAV